jgi:hypothetical protein
LWLASQEEKKGWDGESEGEDATADWDLVVAIIIWVTKLEADL